MQILLTNWKIPFGIRIKVSENFEILIVYFTEMKF